MGPMLDFVLSYFSCEEMELLAFDIDICASTEGIMGDVGEFTAACAAELSRLMRATR